jgi:hypothetical protein
MVKKYNEIEAKNNMEVNADVEVENQKEAVAPEQKKSLDRLVTVQPTKVKRSLLGRLVTGVMGPEGLPSIGAYVNEEIIKPAIKNLIFDTITSAASKAMYGDKGGPNRGGGYGRYSGGGNNSHRPTTNYSNRYSGSSRPDHHEERPVVRSTRYGVEDYIIGDRFEASNILISLTEYADRYDKVSVADYYETIGVPSSQYTDNNYGWTIDTITNATIVPVRGGYIIKFPPVEVL